MYAIWTNAIWTCGQDCYDALETAAKTAAKTADSTAQVKELKEDVYCLTARLQSSNKITEEQ